MENILDINNLLKKYPESNFQLNNISFSMPYGTIMGLIGENGSGKTTTIGCITNAIIKDEGIVKVFGMEMSDENLEIRDNIGIVYDSNSFPEYITPKKISLAMGYIYTNWDNELFKEYLDKWKLPESKEIKTFSRGMVMKLGLAAALSHHPKFLVLDEAMSGLDPIAREELLEALKNFVKEKNRSVLLSSHITADLEKIADYITFIHNGNIILSEKKERLSKMYGIASCSLLELKKINKEDIVAYRKSEYQVDVLISDKDFIRKKYPNLFIEDIGLDDIMLMMIKGEKYEI